MNEETRVSLLAFGVALLALLIALGQLLQQFFGTAEGYRQCQSSVIGPWARLTRRCWRWSQFRFETKYTTPHITIPYPDADTRMTFDRLSLAGNATPWELDATIRPHHAHQSLSRGSKTSSIWLQWRFGRYLPAESAADTVSWLRLLQSMYDHEKQFAPRLGSGDRKEAMRGESRVVVRLKEHSWDLVPPDVVRPMATSIVGTIVLIAKRLGMQWRELDPSKGLMVAEGSGHSMTSSSVVRGLGLVLVYSYRPELKEALLRTVARPSVPFIPGHHADRLLCGILPLAPALNSTTELWLIYRNGRINLDSFFDVLRLPQHCRAALQNLRLQGLAHTLEHRLDQHVGEAFALTSAWIPVLDVSTRYIMWPLPVTGELEGVLYCWEGRKVLLERLRPYMSEDRPGAKCMQDFDKGSVLNALGSSPLEYLEWLASTYWADFYADHTEADAEDVSKILSLHTALQPCMQRVLSAFAERRSAHFEFADLVSAHLVMCTRAAELAEVTYANSDHSTYLSDPRGSRTRTNKFILELAGKYVDDLEGDRTVIKHMRSRGCTLEDGEIEALWWTLMLKGIVWFMSVKIKFPESVTPSYYFYSEVPVYIT